MALGPRAVAILPLSGGDKFGKPINSIVANPALLRPPTLDPFTWRARSSMAGTPRTERLLAKLEFDH